MALASFLLQHQSQLGADTYIFKLSCNCLGTALAAATSDHSVHVIDPQTFQLIHKLVGHEDVVEDLNFFQADAACLASCSHDGSARIWDLRASGAQQRRFQLASHEAYSCAVGHGDAWLASAASEKVHIFDVGSGKRLRTYKDFHTDVVNFVRFHPIETSRLLSGAEDNLVVMLDTDQPRDDDALLGVIPNEECVRSFSLVGPDRNTLCCASTTEDVRIWGLSESDFGSKRAEFLGLRSHPLLERDEAGGYVVETFFDQPSGQVLILAGSGGSGDLLLFRASMGGAEAVATFSAPPDGGASQGHQGHQGLVRSAVCMPGGVVFTAGEDGVVCAWQEALAALPRIGEAPGSEALSGEAPFGGPGGGRRFAVEPTAYGAQRAAAALRSSPY